MSFLTNSGILHFLPAEKFLIQNRAYSYGAILPLVEQVGVVPPFQFSRELGELGFDNPTLIRRSDGTEYSILIPLQLTGITGETVATAGDEIGYEMIVYPGSAALPVTGLTEGLHNIRFEDSMGNVYYSEYFSWIQGLQYRDDYLKIEWWHNDDITFSGGKIRYVFPYKQRIWLQTDIGKPDYMVEEKVVKRDGVDFALQTISYKLHKFSFDATEYILDSMSLIRAHDSKVITHMGRVIGEGDFDKIYSFLLTVVEWEEQGAIASVDVEFRTNPVVIENGRQYEDLAYEVAECGCFETNYLAEAWITESSPEYIGGYWTNEYGQGFSFAIGDYVVVSGAFTQLKQWNGSTYIDPPIADLETVCLVHDSRTDVWARESNYFYQASTIGNTLAQNPVVLVESNVDSVYTISGDTFENTLIEIWLLTDGGDILQGTYTENDFTSGIEFDASGSNGYYVVARTAACPNIGQSDAVTFEGIGWWIIEDTFEIP